MTIQFYASIPVSYLTPDLPLGRYLVSAAGMWDRKSDLKTEKIGKFLYDDRYDFIIDSGGWQFRDGYPEGYLYIYQVSAEVWKRGTWIQPDRIGDLEWTQAHRSEWTIPVVRAECGETEFQISDLRGNEMIAVGGLKQIKPQWRRLILIQQAIATAAHYGIKRVHLLGVGLKDVQRLPPVEKIYQVQVSCDSGSWNGRFGSRINEFNDIMQANGWTQRETALRHYLPIYRAKVEGSPACARKEGE